MDSGENDSSSHRLLVDACKEDSLDFCEIRPWGGIPKFSPCCSDVHTSVPLANDKCHVSV